MPRKAHKRARQERREVARVRAAVLNPRSACPDIMRADAKVLLDEIDRLNKELDKLRADTTDTQ